MAKKILSTLAGGMVLLLALLFALIILVQQKAFFGTAIMWMLFACVAILLAFVAYLVFSRITEIVRESKYDEGKLSERHIEKILSTGSSKSIKMQLDEEERLALEEAEKKQEDLRREDERLRTVRRQEEYDQYMRENEEKERATWEMELLKPQQELRDKIGRIQSAEETALQRANEMPDERDRRFAMGEHEALQRAREEAENQLSQEMESARRVKIETEQEEQRRMEEQEHRRAMEMESMRRQAEAMEMARRRSAQIAATGSMQTPRINLGAVPTSAIVPGAYTAQHTRATAPTNTTSFNIAATGTRPSAVPAQHTLAGGRTSPLTGLASRAGTQVSIPVVIASAHNSQLKPQQQQATKTPQPNTAANIWEKMNIPSGTQQVPSLYKTGIQPTAHTGFVSSLGKTADSTAPLSRIMPTAYHSAKKDEENPYSLKSGTGYIVPKHTSQQFKNFGASSVDTRKTVQQAAAVRSMGGGKPLLDTESFSVNKLKNFQQMNDENIAKPEQTQSPYLPGNK